MSLMAKQNKLQQANDYIKNNINKVDNTYRQKYHIMPQIGWMNDIQMDLYIIKVSIIYFINIIHIVQYGGRCIGLIQKVVI